MQCKKGLQERVKADLVKWYDRARPESGGEPERYVVCAGLAVLERMRALGSHRSKNAMRSSMNFRDGWPTAPRNASTAGT